MGLYDIIVCNCGSGKPSRWQTDARGIPVARVCRDCRERRLSGYRKEIFTDSRYQCDEPVDPYY